MNKWIEYTGSDEQIEEMKNCESGLVETNCKHCNKEFKAKIKEIKRGWGLYCSKWCKYTQEAWEELNK